MTLRKSNWIAAACLAALSCTASVGAQDDGTAGIVRITDGRVRTAAQPASFHGHHGGYGQSAGYSGCPNCDCQSGISPTAFNGFFQERYCKNSPDHGYSPPAKYPLHRRGVQYNAYFPNHWYGTPGASYAGAPMVYQPTDTTQLGFSYQHVPFWQPQPGMMPQRPVPAQWHITAPTVHASRFHNGYGGCQCPNCQMQMQMQQMDGGSPVMNNQPTEIQGPTEVKPEASLPPSPRQFQDSATSGHIRRAGY
jgi:hypothetical protein